MDGRRADGDRRADSQGLARVDGGGDRRPRRLSRAGPRRPLRPRLGRQARQRSVDGSRGVRPAPSRRGEDAAGGGSIRLVALRSWVVWAGVTLLALEAMMRITPAGARSAVTPRPAAIVVEDWSEQPLGRVGIPIGWEAQSWGRAGKYDFKVELRGDGDEVRKVLRLRSDGDNSTISKRVGG